MKKSVQLRYLVVTSMLLGTAATMNLVQAEEELPVYDLGTRLIAVEGQRGSKSLVVAPVQGGAHTSLVTAEQIEAKNYKTVSDALANNNVNIVKKGFVAYPVVNGDSRVLVLVDGKKMNWNHLVTSGDDNAVDVDQIPMENVERIEVVHGPSSSQYGEKAVAGVINIITKKGEPGSHTVLNTEYGTWRHQRYGLFQSGGDEKNRYKISYAKEKQDNFDYINARGRKVEFQNSDINREQLALGYDRIIGDDRLSFDFNRNEKNDAFGNYLTDVETGKTYGLDGDRIKETDLMYGFTYTFGSQSQGEDTFLRYYRAENEANSPFAGTPYSHDLTRDTFEGQKAWQLSSKNKLISGFMWANDHLKEDNDGSSMDASSITKAVFLEDHQELSNGFSIDLGARYDHSSEFSGDWTSHASLNKKFGETTRAYLAWGQAINNPTLKMLYADTPYMKGNPNLEQERSSTWSTGIESQLSEKWSVAANYYTSKVNNALNWAWDGYTRYYNVDVEKRHGFSLSSNYKVNDAWSIRGSFASTSIDSTDVNQVYLNRNTKPNIYTLGVNYQKNKWSADADLNYVTGLERTRFTDRRYFTLDMGVNYQMNETTKFYLKGYNLTNEHYESIGVNPVGGWYQLGAFAMPSRHIVGGVNYSF